jgi:hypothetical protein
MEPQQPYGSFPPAPSGNPYDFITSSNKAPKPVGIGRGSGNSFVGKLVLIIGGAIILMVVIVFVINLLFGNKTNVASLLTLAQKQQEIARVAAFGQQGLSDQAIAGAAVNTRLTMITQQQTLITYLSAHKQKINPKNLALKKDTATDKRFTQAKATSTFDIVFAQVLRQQLQEYSDSVKTSYNNSTSQQAKKLLAADYQQTQMLLKQWPAQ